MVELRTLGGLQLTKENGRPAPAVLRQPKRLALLVYLACANDGFVRRDELLALFWPELSQERGRHALRQSLYFLRRQLGPGVVVAQGEDELRAGAVRCDAKEFEEGVGRGDLEDALALYRGEFLTGFHASDAAVEFEDWLSRRREHYRQLATHSAWSLCQRGEQAGDLEAAVRSARTAVQAAPVDEAGLRRLLSLLARQGDRTGAVEAYQSFERRLRASYDLEPSAETRAVLDAAVRSPRRSEAPGGSAPGNGKAASTGPGDVSRSRSERRWSTPDAAILPAGRGRVSRRTQVDEPAPAVATVPEPEIPQRATPAPAALPPPEPQPWESFRDGRWRRWVGLWAAAMLAGLALFVGYRFTRGGAAAAGPVRIVVLPAALYGHGDSLLLRTGVAHLLGADLDGAGRIRVVDPRVVAAFLSGESGPSISPEAARRAATQFRAAFFLMPSVLSNADRVRLTVSLYDAKGEEPQARTEVEGPDSSLFDLVDRLALQLLSQPAGPLSVDFPRTAAMETSSPDAFKWFLRGELDLRDGRLPQAMAEYARAVNADSGFALAHYRLSVAADLALQPALADSEAGAAMRYAARLGPRDQDLVRAWQAYRSGDAFRAEHLYQMTVQAYPEEPEAWYQLGNLVLHFNPLRARPAEEARPSLVRALELDPANVDAMHHLVQLDALQGDWHGVATLADSALRVAPRGRLAPQMRLWRAMAGLDRVDQTVPLPSTGGLSDMTIVNMANDLAVFAGQPVAAESLALRLDGPGRSDEARAYGRILAAELELARGRWTAARRHLEAAADLEPLQAAQYLASLATLPWVPAPASDLQGIRAQLLLAAQEDTIGAGAGGSFDESDPLRVPYLTGLLSARLADTTAVDSSITRLQRSVTMQPLATRDALLVRAALGPPDSTWASRLRTAGPVGITIDQALLSPFRSLPRLRWMRAGWLAASGRDEAALRWYSSLEALSIHDLVYAAPARMSMAALHASLGQTAQAAADYRAVIHYWADCDPAFEPFVNAARQQLAKLAR